VLLCTGTSRIPTCVAGSSPILPCTLEHLRQESEAEADRQEQRNGHEQIRTVVRATVRHDHDDDDDSQGDDDQRQKHQGDCADAVGLVRGHDLGDEMIASPIIGLWVHGFLPFGW
jgi:hypothetical protein